MGKALAEEILADYNGNVKGKTLGIVITSADSEAAINRTKGVQDALKDTEENSLKIKPKVDLVAALDDTSLTTAGEYAAENNLHGALVYGIGNSTEAVYYLDTGIVESLVVPDEFNVGYQSLTEVAKNLNHFFHKMKNQTLSYTILHREELFTKENQEILFTMCQ